MRFRRSQANVVAMERLKSMAETGNFDCSSSNLSQMKKEVSEIVCRYVDMAPEDYEIRILLTQKQKRA